MKNKSKNIIIISIAIILIGLVFILFRSINKIDKKDIKGIKELNEKLDEYYMKMWDSSKFISSYSYFTKYNGEEVKISDIEESLDYSFPKELKDTSFHFLKPKDLKPFLNDKISNEDQEILTVYTAIPIEEGVFISSKYDEGGILSNEEYKNLVMSQSWVHGDIKNPIPDDIEYKEIVKATIEKDSVLKDGNVKHLAHDDKYGIIVMSSKVDPAYIKQYALEKNKDKGWKIIVEDLEMVDSRIFVNYAYTDFELGLLPKYEISEYKNISSKLDSVINQLKSSGDLDNSEKPIYSCTAGNFTYIEYESGLKTLLYKQSKGTTDIFEVDNFKTALSKMIELEKNAPIFILNFK